MDLLLALAPIVIILVLMAGYRWGAARAGPAGWSAAVLIAILRFGGTLEMLAYAQVKALLLTLDVLYIVWMAYLLFKVAEQAGAVEGISRALRRLTEDRGMQALLVGWCFSSFLQGVGGYGVPVAVIAPLLIGLGFAPLTAVVIPSVGHSWSVTFGSLGASFQALIAASGLPGEALAPPTALMLGLGGLLCGFLVAYIAGGVSAVHTLWLPILILGTGMGAAQYGLATSGAWSLGGTGAGLAGLGLGFVLARRYRGDVQGWVHGETGTQVDREPGTVDQMDRQENRIGLQGGNETLLVLSGYLILVALTLVFQLIPAVEEFVGRVKIVVQFPEISTRLGYVTPAGTGRTINVFGHAGASLLYSSVLAYWIYLRAGRYQEGAGRRILSSTLKGVVPSSLGIVAMVSMAVIMAHAGMTETLARGLASSVGAAYPVVSPFIGALGAFMTGSNTNSNAVFAILQLRTAELLHLSVPVILAAQTSGAAMAAMLSPTKIVVGASTAGLAGQEGPVLRTLLPYGGLLVLLVSAVAWILTR